MENKKLKNCPKCGGKINKKYEVVGTGCEWCNPKCRYCGKKLKTFIQEHLPNCKEFNKMIKGKEQ